MYVHSINTIGTRTDQSRNGTRSVVGHLLMVLSCTFRRWMTSTLQANRALKEGKAFDTLSEDLSTLPRIRTIRPEDRIAPLGELHVVIVSKPDLDEETRFLVRLAVAQVSGRIGVIIRYRFSDDSH